MNSDRVKGQSKELEGKAQQKWADVKDSAEDAWEDVTDEGEDLARGIWDRRDDDESTRSSSR